MSRRTFPCQRRADERGATLFVVVLAITLLTGIGLFTVHSSAMLARAAGSVRQSQQADVLAEAVSFATISALSAPGTAKTFTDMALSNGLNNTADCIANLGMSATNGVNRSCYKFGPTNLPASIPVALMAPDSFGTTTTSSSQPALTYSYTAELTDVANSTMPVPGFSAIPGAQQAQMRFVTLTTTAGVIPQVAAANCTPNIMQTSTQNQMRAYLLVGPIMP